jgi:hypothetical protein
MARQSHSIATGHDPVRLTIKAASGDIIAKVVDQGDASRIVIDRIAHQGFADYVVQELPALFERYAAGTDHGPGTKRR